MHQEPAHWLHAAVGATALALYWAALVSTKGSRGHRVAGRRFVFMVAPVLLTVGGIFFASSRVFAGPEVVQFMYLVACMVAVTSTGYRAIRWRHDLERFRGPAFRVLGVASFVMGALLLVIGLVARSAMPVIFSVIGLLFGGAMVRFAWMKGPVHPNWALIWHLNAMCFLFNAVHGTVAAVAWKLLVAPGAGREVNAVTQLVTMAIALALRVAFGERFQAPIRLRPAPSGGEPATESRRGSAPVLDGREAS